MAGRIKRIAWIDGAIELAGGEFVIAFDSHIQRKSLRRVSIKRFMKLSAVPLPPCVLEGQRGVS